MVFLLILSAVALGFAVGRWSLASRLLPSSSATRAVPRRYFESLNQLLHEQHDVALETFVSSLDVNPDTLETHLALGSLLRKRGEVDRAIRIHQNLLTQPGLQGREMEQAQLELALDYKVSGLLDRAEALLRELQSTSSPEIGAAALANLVEVYQDEQEWQKAIDSAEKLCTRKPAADLRHWRHLQANYACELAEIARQRGDMNDFHKWTQKALEFEKHSARAAINMGFWHLAQGRSAETIRWLSPLVKQGNMLVETLPLVSAAYKNLGNRTPYLDFLLNVFEKSPSPALYLPLADELEASGGSQAASTFLRKALAKDQTLSVVSRSLALCGAETVSYADVRAIVADNLPPVFTCKQCGFEGGRLYWCCPTCNSWL